MQRSRWLLVLLALLGATMLPAPATAATLRTAPLASTTALPVGDGRSLVAWRAGPSLVGTIDAAGRRSAVRLRADCTGPLLAAGAGRFLVGCTPTEYVDPAAPYDVIAVRTGAARRVLVRNPYSPSADGATPTFRAIGAQWMRGDVGFHQGQTSFYVNWRTGRQVAGDQDPFGARSWLDLSASALGRPLCRPHTRKAIGDAYAFGPQDRFTPSPTVDGRWVLAGTSHDRQGRLQGLGVGRCGGRLRPFGSGDVSQATLGGGVLSWQALPQPGSRRGTTHVRRLSDGRTWTTRAADGAVMTAGRTVVLAQTVAGSTRLRVGRVPAR